MKFLPFLLWTVPCTHAHLLRQESAVESAQWEWNHKADPSHGLRLSIALPIDNADFGAEKLLRISDPRSPEYGQHLSPAEIVELFRPKRDAVFNVMAWLEESGIDRDQLQLSHGGGHVSVELSVEKAATLLKTTFYRQTHQETGRQQIACQYYHIPEALAGSIDYVLTTSPLPEAPFQPHVPRQQSVLGNKLATAAPLPGACYTSTTLTCLRQLYKIPQDIVPHPNNTFGVFETSWYTWLEEDLDSFFKELQKDLVGHRPKVEGINGGYLQRNFTGEHWNTEPNLDFEYTMALTSPHEVTNVQVGSYQELGNLDNMLSAFDKWYCDPVNDGDKHYPPAYPPGCTATHCDCGSSAPPKVLSISWGWSEAQFTSKYLQRQCLEFLKLGLMGTTVVVSVSDHGTASGGGSFCIDDPTKNGSDGKFSPIYPASCPWVTSVGGTQMVPPTEELVANETTFRKVVGGRMASSGGGFSNVFSSPSYQAPNVALYKALENDHLNLVQARFNSTGRGYPDVAARADDYWIVTNGKWKPVSGTSASNPVFASIITLINSERMHAGKGPVGFINPALYSNPDMLNDVTTGANLGCGADPAFRAARGWDPVTGMGSPDYERMRDFFMGLP